MAIEVNYDKLYSHMQENFKRGLEYHQECSYQKAIEKLQKALGTCEILDDLDKKAEILYHLGHAYQMRNSAQDYLLAEDCYQELLEMGNTEYYSQVQFNRAAALVTRGEYQKAIEIFEELHALDSKHTDSWLMQIFAYFCLGKFTDDIYFQEAIKCCEKAIESVDTVENAAPLYYAYHNLGHIYYELGENVKAMVAFQDALEYCPNKTEWHKTLVDMSVVLVRLSQYELARAYSDKAQEYFEKRHEVLGLASCLYAKGKQNKQRGRIEEATNYFELALSGYREKEYYYGIVKTFYELYELYRRINPEKADLYYEQYKFYLNYVSPMGGEPAKYQNEEDPMWV